jgi:hypothetical protein
VGQAERGWSNDAWAFNARQMACVDAVGLLLVFVEGASSSPPNKGGNGGGGIIARSTLTHPADAGRVNLANYSTCLHRLARVAASSMHPGSQDNKDRNGGGPEQSRGGPGSFWTSNLRCWCACSGDGLDLGRMANLKLVDKQAKELVELKLQVLVEVRTSSG